MGIVKKWVLNKNRREVLAFLGGGAAVAVGAVWTAIVFWRDRAETPQKIEATYSVCVGASRDGCPANTVFLRCGQSVADWAKAECGSYSEKLVSVDSGGMCGYRVVQIKCTVGK